MIEQDRPGEKLSPVFTFREVEEPITGLDLVRNRCHPFIIGDFENGEFLRFRPIFWRDRLSLALSQVSQHIEKPPKLYSLEFETTNHLEGTDIKLMAVPRIMENKGRGIRFIINAPKDLNIAREELISWSYERPQLTPRGPGRIGGLSVTIKQLESFLIGDINGGNYLRLRLLTWTSPVVYLSLSQIIEDKESPTNLAVVILNNIYLVKDQKVHFSLPLTQDGGNQLKFRIMAPREITIVREELIAPRK